MTSLCDLPVTSVLQIVEYVEAIIAKGLAYESNGSVYMDIAAYRAAGHDYPKLEPSKGKATAAEMAESEGTLHTAAAGEKRSASDFALWKASKKGEPSWDSPWGGGRPGWHIGKRFETLPYHHGTHTKPSRSPSPSPSPSPQP